MDEEIKIEKNIPAPKVWGHTKYPLSDMEVGDSFEVPKGRHSSLSTARRTAQQRYTDRRWTIRRQHDGTYRIWRIA